jgi:hypothetical protein
MADNHEDVAAHGADRKRFRLAWIVFSMLVGLAGIVGTYYTIAAYYRDRTATGTASGSIIPRENLVSRIDAFVVALPSKELIKLMDAIESTYEGGLEAYLEDEKFTAGLDESSAGVLKAQLDQLRIHTSTGMKTIKDLYYKRIRDVYAFYRVEIENKGDVPLSGVFFRFPDIDMISEMGDRVQVPGKVSRGSDGDIFIGTIKQKDTVTFFIWGSSIYRLATSPEESIVLGHDRGVGQISYFRLR